MRGCGIEPMTKPVNATGTPSQQSVGISPEAMRLNADDFVPQGTEAGIEIGGA